MKCTLPAEMRGRLALFAFVLLLVAATQRPALAQEGADGVFAVNEQAIAANNEGRVGEAVERGREALALARSVFGEDSANTITIASNYGQYLMAAGDLAGAASQFEFVLAGYRTLAGEDSPESLGAQYDLAELSRQQGRLGQAKVLFSDLLERSQRVLGEEGGVTVLAANGLGLIHMGLGEFDAAAPLFRRVIALETTADGKKREIAGANAPQVIAAAIGNLAELERQRGNYQEAESLLLRILPGDLEKMEGFTADQLVTTQSLAAMQLAQGNFASADKLFRNSGDAGAKLLGEGHPVVLQFRSNLAALLVQAGKAREADDLLAATRSAAEASLGPDHPTSLVIANNLAVIRRDQGRNADAEALLKDVLERRERVLGIDHPDTLETAGNLAVIYIDEERYLLAEPLLRRSVKAAQAKLGTDHLVTLAQSGNLALVLARTGRLDEAEAAYKQLRAAIGRGFGENHPRALLATNNLARLLSRQGREAEAGPLYRSTYEGSLATLGMTHPQTLASATNYANYLAASGKTAEADGIYKRALDANVAAFGKDHPVTTNIASLLAKSRLTEGQAQQALEPARLAARGLRARRELRPQGDRAALREDTAGLRDAALFSLVADADWAAGNRGILGVSEAFTALQDAMAGVTDKAVASMALRRFAEAKGAGLAELVRQSDELTGAWQAADAAYGASLASTGPAALAQRETIKQQLQRIETRLGDIEARIRGEFPEYFALTRNAAIGLAELQKVLAPDEAVLLLVPTEFGTHAMALTSDGGLWVRSEVDADGMAQAVKRLLWDVGANVDVPLEQEVEWEDEGGPGYPFDRTTAYNIYRQLIEPVNSALAGKRHVFVAAAGSLSSLPLGLLVTAPPEGADGDPAALRATKWFGDAHALTQIPSVQSLIFLRAAERAEKTGAGGFVGFGDPLLAGEGEERGIRRGAKRKGGGVPRAASLFGDLRGGAGQKLADPAQIAKLARLPGTARELTAMREALGAPQKSLHLGGEATETALKSMDLSGARIIALATHGVLAGELKNAEPGLVFTPPSRASLGDDGLLTSSEIATLRLNADWVILSACNTAAGDGSEGAPGMSGLARSFFYAGARSLLASHWPVRDDVAARLTVRSLEIQDKEGVSRAEALQRAMREIRNDASHDNGADSWAHPNAWAPFTLIGDGAK